MTLKVSIGGNLAISCSRAVSQDLWRMQTLHMREQSVLIFAADGDAARKVSADVRTYARDQPRCWMK